MAAKQQAPRAFELSGRAYASYQAGDKMGQRAAYGVCSENLRRVREAQIVQLKALADSIDLPDDHPSKAAVDSLPVLADGLTQIAAQFDKRADACRLEGNRVLGQLAASETAEDARWRPPLRAWGLLVLAMCVSTTVATLAAVYATRVSW